MIVQKMGNKVKVGDEILKKHFLKRLLACILAVMILSVSIGDLFIIKNDIKTVDATGLEIGGIAVASLAEICLFVGSVAVTVYCVGEVIDNREEIARFGYNLINSCSETVDGWIMSFTDTAGQEYVYGTEALDLVRETEWEVIQGGLPPENNDDDNNNDNKPTKNPMQNLWNLTALGATWLMSNISNLYQKWVNGEELTEAEHAVLAPVIEGYCDQNDIAEQWSGKAFSYAAKSHVGYVGYDKRYVTIDYDYSFLSSTPVCAYYYEDTASHTNSNGVLVKLPWHHVIFYTLNSNGNLKNIGFQGISKTYFNGVLSSSSSGDAGGFSFFGDYDYPERNVFSYSVNFPVFSSRIEAEAYLKGTGAVTDALNYAKTYQIADWLSDDWAGILIDPLTNVGLSLNQLLAVAQQLGVHAIGNNLSPAELSELLKQLLTGADLSLLPGIPAAPVVLPSPELPPVYWPNIDAHPLPGTTPGTKPDPDKDPDKEPGKEPEPDEDMSSYKVDLQAIFPFCIPFDFIALLRVLDAEPEAPRFDFPVVIPALDYHETVTFDMSIFDDVAEVIRLCETVSFIIFLMFSTSKVIKW